MAKEIIKMGMVISLGGPVTFKNARHSVEVAREIPLDKILIETDSPYLAPEPLRGKRNSPEYVRFVAEKIAQIKGETFETVARVTKENAMKLFKI